MSTVRQTEEKLWKTTEKANKGLQRKHQKSQGRSVWNWEVNWKNRGMSIVTISSQWLFAFLEHSDVSAGARVWDQFSTISRTVAKLSLPVIVGFPVAAGSLAVSDSQQGRTALRGECTETLFWLSEWLGVKLVFRGQGPGTLNTLGLFHTGRIIVPKMPILGNSDQQLLAVFGGRGLCPVYYLIQ